MALSLEIQDNVKSSIEALNGTVDMITVRLIGAGTGIAVGIADGWTEGAGTGKADGFGEKVGFGVGLPVGLGVGEGCGNAEGTGEGRAVGIGMAGTAEYKPLDSHVRLPPS